MFLCVELFTFNVYLHLHSIFIYIYNVYIYLQFIYIRHSLYFLNLVIHDFFYQLKKLAINSLYIAFLNHLYFLLKLHFHPPSSFSLSFIWDTEKAMAPHSSTLAWKIPWTEEPGRLQSMGSLRVGHD